MKAIVLSFDKQHGFSELTYKTYMEKWPDCPLTFRIPWNEIEHEKLKGKENVELIQCKPDIRSTMDALLSNLDDREWVFWCIDDRYPMEIRDPSYLTSLHNFLLDNETGYNAIKLFYWKEKLDTNKKEEIVLGKKYALQDINSRFGLWHHHFCRAEILKKLFLSDKIPKKYSIAAIAHLYHSIAAKIPALSQNILVPKEDNLILGEPCWQGQITKNGYNDLIKYDCQIPDHKILNFEKTFLNRQTEAIKR